MFFNNRVEHVKFVDFCGKYRLPLLQYLCSRKCIESRDGDEVVSGAMIRKVLLGWLILLEFCINITEGCYVLRSEGVNDWTIALFIGEFSLCAQIRSNASIRFNSRRLSIEIREELRSTINQAFRSDKFEIEDYVKIESWREVEVRGRIFVRRPSTRID